MCLKLVRKMKLEFSLLLRRTQKRKPLLKIRLKQKLRKNKRESCSQKKAKEETAKKDKD